MQKGEEHAARNAGDQARSQEGYEGATEAAGWQDKAAQGISSVQSEWLKAKVHGHRSGWKRLCKPRGELRSKKQSRDDGAQGTANRGGGWQRGGWEESGRLKSHEWTVISHTNTGREDGRGGRNGMTQVLGLSAEVGMSPQWTESA